MMLKEKIKKLFKLLNEVAIDDFEKGRVIQLKPNSYEWYMGHKAGESLRHTKVLFKTKELQRQICKEYKLHDPTKVQDKCIEILLCKPNIKGFESKWVAISTLRKLKPECVINHPETYAKVPWIVLRRAIANLKKVSISGQKEALDAVIKAYLKNVKQNPKIKKEIIKKSLKDKPIYVESPNDFVTKVILKLKS